MLLLPSPHVLSLVCSLCALVVASVDHRHLTLSHPAATLSTRLARAPLTIAGVRSFLLHARIVERRPLNEALRAASELGLFFVGHSEASRKKNQC